MWLTHLVQHIFPKKKSFLKVFQEFSPPPQPCGLLQELIYFAVEIFAEFQVFQRELKPKIDTLILPGVCQLFALSVHIPCGSLPVLHQFWGCGPDRYRKFAFLNRILVSTLGMGLPYSRGEQSCLYMRLLSRNGCWGKRERRGSTRLILVAMQINQLLPRAFNSDTGLSVTSFNKSSEWYGELLAFCLLLPLQQHAETHSF